MNIKKIYAKILSGMANILGVDIAKEFDAYIRFHKKLNLKKPETLSDKITYIELHEQSPLVSMCTDKYAVREYIREKGLGEFLIPIVAGPWEQVRAVNLEELPNSFVLKATHGCKMNYLVPDKGKMDEEECIKEMKRWMETTYGSYSLELHYLSIPHRIYAEKFLKNASQLNDYKIHCLNGVPRFVLVCSNRKADGDAAMKVTLDLFDMNWNNIKGLVQSGNEIVGNGRIPKPANFEKMIHIAKVLSSDFKFVRVDLYEIEGKIYFGELTFSPGSGVLPYFERDFDLKMGKCLRI